MPSSRLGTEVANRLGGRKDMCLAVFAYDCHPDYWLIFGANRDEFRNRPTEPARYWNSAPHVLAGRDRQAGGTWMGVTTTCLLYTSDAADDLLCVDLGGR